MRLTRKDSRYYSGYYLVGRKNNCKIKIDCDDFKKEFCFYVEHLKSDIDLKRNFLMAIMSKRENNG